MKHKSLIIYFVILTLLCAGFIVGAKALGQQGMYLAQGYMMSPAIAAIITRLFFYENKFRDANLRFGRTKDYLKFWLISVGITALSYVFFTLLGGISWDFTGQAFLERLSQQFAAAGQDMGSSLPPGFTPQMMLMAFFIGGLTVFNILPGIITGFGEEFGHRGAPTCHDRLVAHDDRDLAEEEAVGHVPVLIVRDVHFPEDIRHVG